VGIAVAAWRRSCPALAVGLAWYAVALSPVLGIVKQQGFQSHADRFTYVPHLGLAVAVVWPLADLAARLRFRPGTVAALVLAVLALFVVADERQIRRWRDNETLWAWVLAVEPTNDHGGQYLAAHYARAGQWERAIDLAADIAARYPRTQAFADIAHIREEAGDVVGAFAICRREVDVKRRAHGVEHPETLEATSRLVTALRNAGDPEGFALARQTEAAMRRVLGVAHLATLRTLLVVATAANRSGEPQQAERLAREVLAAIATTRENPALIRKPATIALAESLDRQGKPEEAIAALTATLAALGGTAGTKAVENSQLVVTLAAVYANQGNLTAAEQVLAPVADALARTLGPQHPAARPAAALLDQIRRGRAAAAPDDAEAAR
jgi:tetratricopeptide (TPR) repeat protein